MFQKQCITMNQMNLALNIMVAMKYFSRKWLVVKIRPFLAILHCIDTVSVIIDCTHISLDIYLPYSFIFQNIKFINRLNMLRETIY